MTLVSLQSELSTLEAQHQELVNRANQADQQKAQAIQDGIKNEAQQELIKKYIEELSIPTEVVGPDPVIPESV